MRKGKDVKRCSGCRAFKSLGEFHRAHVRNDGHQAYCKSCRKTYDSSYHQRVRARRLAQVRLRRAQRKEWIRSLKSGPCTDCGTTYPPEAMEWDHLPGYVKLDDVTRLIFRSRRLILDEIAKCDLVCSNCHAIRTRLRLRGVAQLGRAPRLGRGGSVGSSPTAPTEVLPNVTVTSLRLF